MLVSILESPHHSLTEWYSLFEKTLTLLVTYESGFESHLGSESVDVSLTHTTDRNYTSLLALSNLYDIQDIEEIREFMENEFFPLEFLIDCYETLTTYFGKSAYMRLEVFEDPESDNHRQLYITVKTDLPPSEAVNQINQFDEDWWLNQLIWLDGRLCVDVSFL